MRFLTPALAVLGLAAAAPSAEAASAVFAAYGEGLTSDRAGDGAG